MGDIPNLVQHTPVETPLPVQVHNTDTFGQKTILAFATPTLSVTPAKKGE